MWFLAEKRRWISGKMIIFAKRLAERTSEIAGMPPSAKRKIEPIEKNTEYEIYQLWSRFSGNSR